MGSIYKITNTVNGKSYIGKTIHDVERTRIKDHLDNLKRGSVLVTRAVEKYGRAVFVYEILHDGIIPELLDYYEIETIKSYDTLAPNGYNLMIGNDGFIGYTHSKETRRKISEAGMGRKFTNEHHQRISEALKGWEIPAETRQKISKEY